jgi:hypothetical protein
MPSFYLLAERNIFVSEFSLTNFFTFIVPEDEQVRAICAFWNAEVQKCLVTAGFTITAQDPTAWFSDLRLLQERAR